MYTTYERISAVWSARGPARRFARLGKLAYVQFRNVAGKVPHYQETFVDDGDVDMVEIVRILRDEGFDGVMVPDHVPELACAAPWHAAGVSEIVEEGTGLEVKFHPGEEPELRPAGGVEVSCHLYT